MSIDLCTNGNPRTSVDVLEWHLDNPCFHSNYLLVSHVNGVIHSGQKRSYLKASLETFADYAQNNGVDAGVKRRHIDAKIVQDKKHTVRNNIYKIDMT